MVNGKGNIVEINKEINCNLIINGNNNFISVRSSNISNLEINVTGDNHRIMIGDSQITNLQILIKSSDSIPTKNSNVFIGDHTVVQSTQIILQGDDTKVSIGNGTTILGCIFYAVECDSEINLGKRCMLSWGIEIRTSDWHSIYDLETNQRINQPKSVFIDDRVWIGSFVTILKGVNISSDSIIGTHSLVTKSVPANCVVAGNPARVVRKNVRWDPKDYVHKR